MACTTVSPFPLFFPCPYSSGCGLKTDTRYSRIFRHDFFTPSVLLSSASRSFPSSFLHTFSLFPLPAFIVILFLSLCRDAVRAGDSPPRALPISSLSRDHLSPFFRALPRIFGERSRRKFENDAALRPLFKGSADKKIIGEFDRLIGIRDKGDSRDSIEIGMIDK